MVYAAKHIPDQLHLICVATDPLFVINHAACLRSYICISNSAVNIVEIELADSTTVHNNSSWADLATYL